MHKKVFEYIDSRKGELIEFTKELVSIPTVNPPGENYSKILKILEQRCKRLRLVTKRIVVPKSVLKRYKIDSREKRICLLAKWNVGSNRTVHINGHYDVVPAGGDWHTDPFRPVVKNGRIYGRGTEDMKGNIACYLMAVSALRRYNLEPGCNLEFSFTPDEEIGGETGFGYLVKNKIINSDYGIGEGYAGRFLSYGNKGVLWFKIEVKGKSAHASKPYKGINSFEKLVAVTQELMNLNKKISKRRTVYMTRDKRDRFSTMVLGGRLWGGGETNIVPDVSGFTIDRRFLPEENITTVKRELYECVNKARKRMKDLKVKIKTIVEQDCAVCNFRNKLSNSFSKAINQALVKKAKFAIMAGATDMRFLMEKGIPCIGYSAEGGGRCHADNEYIWVKSLLDTAKIFAYVFANLKG
ncbi:MAG: M20 family metallopeptidase [Candidatus Omnitrophota bacterium]|nr:MAG: M20 family metallopeptidase [Candidatus Omnitrophota bacterium]